MYPGFVAIDLNSLYREYGPVISTLDISPTHDLLKGVCEYLLTQWQELYHTNHCQINLEPLAGWVLEDFGHYLSPPGSVGYSTGAAQILTTLVASWLELVPEQLYRIASLEDVFFRHYDWSNFDEIISLDQDPVGEYHENRRTAYAGSAV